MKPLGWMNVVGWQSAVAGVGFLNASLIQGISALNSTSYSPEPWQATLMFWAVVLVAVFVNTVVSSLLPKVEGLVLILHVLGFFAILIPLVSMGPRGDATDVFTVFVNGGAWPTTGVSFMVGLVATTWNFLGADGAVHVRAFPPPFISALAY
jgi:choline transport protein